MQLIHGDCLDVMRQMEENSVDAIVTDPPYGISFMGKKWDYNVPNVDIATARIENVKVQTVMI